MNSSDAFVPVKFHLSDRALCHLMRDNEPSLKSIPSSEPLDTNHSCTAIQKALQAAALSIQNSSSAEEDHPSSNHHNSNLNSKSLTGSSLINPLLLSFSSPRIPDISHDLNKDLFDAVQFSVMKSGTENGNGGISHSGGYGFNTASASGDGERNGDPGGMMLDDELDNENLVHSRPAPSARPPVIGFSMFGMESSRDKEINRLHSIHAQDEGTFISIFVV